MVEYSLMLLLSLKKAFLSIGKLKNFLEPQTPKKSLSSYKYIDNNKINNKCNAIILPNKNLYAIIKSY